MNSLTPDEMALLVRIIDLAVERAAFKGNEIYTVGQLREKLANIVIESQKTPEEMI